jgi:exodeoxyribonuclease V alpha subunit
MSLYWHVRIPSPLLTLQENGHLSPMDIHFARFLTSLVKARVDEMAVAAALVSRFTREGHIGLDLGMLAGNVFPEGEEEGIACPPLGAWLEKLGKSPVVGRPGQRRPLTLDDGHRLYLFRYWDYQEKLVGAIKGRLQADREIDIPLLRQGIERLFPGNITGETDWQRVAAVTALLKDFCVISGGPGTGKTTTISKILALMVEQCHPQEPRIALAAPTGKAAARLKETVTSAKASLNVAPGILNAIPHDATTIHRLLGSIPGSPYFRYHGQHRLPLGAVVVDEASMVDMALMSKLVQAVPDDARLILVGDRDQLASVEAGAVLGDICNTGHRYGFSEAYSRMLQEITGDRMPPSGREGAPIRDAIIHMAHSYRFGKGSGMGEISRAVNGGKGGLALEIFRDDAFGNMRWRDLPLPDDMTGQLRATIQEAFKRPTGDTPTEHFDRLDQCRILCAVREGPYGVKAVNMIVERLLQARGIMDSGRLWYPGRPVMITKNDYDLQLYNGDVGIVLPDPDRGHELSAFFPSGEGGFKTFHPLRLPEHETVYAMTVHKSQGSEFERVLMILPDRDSPLLTRELIYTGITRAREGVEIWTHEDVFLNAVSRRIQRTSGLRDALWNGPLSPL